MSTQRPARLLVMVWDGMRPDMVSPELTPNLVALAASGVTFDANHAVVPTVTRINAATLATGAPSSVHGLPGNYFFAPRIDLTGPISIGEGDNVALVFADVRLPGLLDGVDLARRVKALWPHVSMVVTSGFGARRPEKLPDTVAYMPKPWLALEVLMQAEKAADWMQRAQRV